MGFVRLLSVDERNRYAFLQKYAEADFNTESKRGVIGLARGAEFDGKVELLNLNELGANEDVLADTGDFFEDSAQAPTAKVDEAAQFILDMFGPLELSAEGVKTLNAGGLVDAALAEAPFYAAASYHIARNDSQRAREVVYQALPSLSGVDDLNAAAWALASLPNATPADLETAIRQARMALEQSKDDEFTAPYVAHTLGTALLKAGKVDEARELIGPFAERHPHDSDLAALWAELNPSNWERVKSWF